MLETRLVVKVDVDTDRGTRLGVPALLNLFDEFGIKATFLFSLGPDNTGRAVRRIFRPGFFRKVARTSVVSTYGLRTLMNGVLLPGPHVGRRNEAVMRDARERGHEVGIHCYDHIRWQDGLAAMTREEVYAEYGKASREFERIFGELAKTAGAAGWQANSLSLAAYDNAGLLYASDARGTHAFFPRVDGVVFKTLQIPTTLPTLDELLGRPEYPEAQLVERYLSWMRPGQLNVLTVHAEIEGMSKMKFFHALLRQAQQRSIRFVRMNEFAREYLNNRNAVPVCDLIHGEVDGRSGTLAVQKAA
jgi:peptidoglycan/xylan/chitin deacetylase (PgdA/CDA1 family)